MRMVSTLFMVTSSLFFVRLGLFLEQLQSAINSRQNKNFDTIRIFKLSCHSDNIFILYAIRPGAAVPAVERAPHL